MLGVGSVIGGRFRIDRVLGAGGMGVVVAATHLELDHRVAIKLLHDEMAQSPVIVERFLREARAVVGLRTEHVCRVIDVARLDTGAPYIVMEMLEGVDLQRTVARSPLPLTTAVEYVLQACTALVEAHAAGIIHRDLKPANLFVVRRPDGGPLVKVLDFGIAKALTETGANLTQQSAMGSPGYMSPEQIQSARDVDVRTDIWALGVTLYQLVSARLPFGGTSVTEIAIAVATEPPAPLDIDPRVRAVIWKCLQKRPDDRYATCGELMLALAPFRPRTLATAARPLPRFEPDGGVTTGQSVIVPTHPTQTTQATQLPPPPRESPAQLPGKPRRGARLAVLAVVAVGAVGAVGAAAAGWIVLGGSKVAPVATPAAAPVKAIVVDAAPPSRAVDANTPGVTGDPWAVAGPTDEEIRAAKAEQVEHEHARAQNAVRSIAFISEDIPNADRYLKMLCSQPIAVKQEVGFQLQCACRAKNSKAAEQAFAQIKRDDDRTKAREYCTSHGVTIR